MYWSSISLTSSSASARIVTLSSGISMSFTANDSPALVAKVKPVCINLSAKITVSRVPHSLKLMFIRREISFFFNVLLIISKGKPLGKISDRNERPTVVLWRLTRLPRPTSESSLPSSIRTSHEAWRSISPFSYARFASVTLAKIIPSPLAPIFSLDM